MGRYLVVANRTLGGEHLLEMLRTLVSEGSCQLHVVVPASHPRSSWSEGQVMAEARERLETAMARFRELGAEVTGEVGDSGPVGAVGDVLIRDDRFDQIILSTLPIGPSRWLKQDALHRLQRSVTLPIVHVVAEAEADAMDAPAG